MEVNTQNIVLHTTYYSGLQSTESLCIVVWVAAASGGKNPEISRQNQLYSAWFEVRVSHLWDDFKSMMAWMNLKIVWYKTQSFSLCFFLEASIVV